MIESARQPRFARQRAPRALALAAGLSMLGAIGAMASPPSARVQTEPHAPQVRPPMPSPPENLGAPTRQDRERGIDFLLGALKAAPDPASARHVERRIWALWATTPSDTARLLVARANLAIAAKQYDAALKMLDVVVRLRPDYLEGWNRRATIYYVQDRYEEALGDLQQILSREPRHFGALAGLGIIMKELGDDRRALIALRRAMEIDPHIERVPDLVRGLREKVEGRDI